MVKTTVITLTYDRPAWLDEAIRSIEAQTDQDYEHLIYDNGSKNPSVVEVLREAKRRRPEQLFFASPLRGGRGPDMVGFYWNILLGLARGRYVTILDDDNRKRPDFLEKMTAPLERAQEHRAVSCGWAIIDATGALTGEERHWNLNTSTEKLWQTNTIDSNAIAFRRSALDEIGQFDSTLTTNEDWDFMIRLARGPMLHLPEALVDYREHGQARSRRALELGAHANWKKIRDARFTPEEQREFLIRAMQKEAKP